MPVFSRNRALEQIKIIPDCSVNIRKKVIMIQTERVRPPLKLKIKDITYSFVTEVSPVDLIRKVKTRDETGESTITDTMKNAIWYQMYWVIPRRSSLMSSANVPVIFR